MKINDESNESCQECYGLGEVLGKPCSTCFPTPEAKAAYEKAVREKINKARELNVYFQEE